MNLVLLPYKNASNELGAHYERALASAVELYIVSAYLTEWKQLHKLGSHCEKLRIIVGSDFGITKKKACRDLAHWLPAQKRADFLVADNISGFHPKAVFWRDADRTYHALVGSSNLTKAAFSSNHEANIYMSLTLAQFDDVRKWILAIEANCVPADENWLENYEESVQAPRKSKRKPSIATLEGSEVGLPLPVVADAEELIRVRRLQLKVHAPRKAALEELFRLRASEAVSKEAFYERLKKLWTFSETGDGNRLQHYGWERRGKSSDFLSISKSFIEILAATNENRDDVVAANLDKLAAVRDPARSAFFSEMLCLAFPSLYPVKDAPIKDYLAEQHFRPTRGASEGAQYIELARWLRMSLRVNPSYPAKSLAELDTLIWGAYGRTKRNG